jgi:hypothetical protein
MIVPSFKQDDEDVEELVYFRVLRTTINQCPLLDTRNREWTLSALGSYASG